MGVNRVSLGVQSFIQRELNQVGRRHTASIVMEDVAALRAEGIGNINVDLIAGLPHQTAESWNESLDCLAMLDVPHVSVYIFELDEDSRLGKEMSEGGSRYGAAQAPSDDLTVELYRRAGERLAAAGCVRYEISNFAKPGFESLHNLTYWRREPYVGFGLDAHSFDGRQRWANSADLSNYMAAIREGTQPQSEAVDDEEEHFFVGLRMARGIQPTEAERRRFRGPIERWRTEGLLLDDGVTLRLSNRGILLSNEVLQEFIDD